jgi:hypothetical protein
MLLAMSRAVLKFYPSLACLPKWPSHVFMLDETTYKNLKILNSSQKLSNIYKLSLYPESIK